MTLLILAGTSEGRDIAAALERGGTRLIVSLANAVRSPRAPGAQTRIGGFGGASGFASFLRDEAITAVLDATHPFADQISHRSARICAQLGVPYALYARPAWKPAAGDHWTAIAREEDAAAHIEQGATVFLATGRRTLERFANLSTCKLICRQIDAASGDFPFPNGTFLTGTPPFSVEDEIALFRKLQVDWLIVKNAGGQASYSKLDAARALGLRVGMIERPAMPDAYRLRSVEDAVAWGKAHG